MIEYFQVRYTGPDEMYGFTQGQIFTASYPIDKRHNSLIKSLIIVKTENEEDSYAYPASFFEVLPSEEEKDDLI